MVTFDLSELHSYRGIWALSTVNKKTGMLKATHYTWPIVHGKHPIWVVYTVNGRFIQHLPGRSEIERQYPNLAWRRVMAKWSLLDPTDHATKLRIQELPGGKVKVEKQDGRIA